MFLGMWRTCPAASVIRGGDAVICLQGLHNLHRGCFCFLLNTDSRRIPSHMMRPGGSVPIHQEGGSVERSALLDNKSLFHLEGEIGKEVTETCF